MKNNQLRIIAITGIKSEYDILFPVLKNLKDNGHELLIAVSGAHLSDQHNNTINRIIDDGFNIVEKIDSLLSTDRIVQRSKGVGLIIQGLTQTVERTDPDFILVVGDREESIAAGIVGNYMEKLVVHIGGGDPVFGNSDDPIRFAVSKLSHVHCCFAKEYGENLLNIGEEKFRIFVTGNPAYTNIDLVPFINKSKLCSQLGVTNENYIVLILHPLSSELEKSAQQMKKLLKALDKFCNSHNIQAICIPPNSDPGSFGMKNVINEYLLSDWFIKLDTLPRVQFVNLIRNSMALVGNSSMGILEAPHYKIPVVNTGNRQKGRLNAGNVEFVPFNINSIIKALKKATTDKKYRHKIKKLNNPFGNNSSANNIRQAIESVDLNERKWYVKKKLC